MSTSFNAAIRKVIHTLSNETMLEYVMSGGGLVMCPPATKHVLHVNSMLTSKIK
jgi:hypothetical protein